jgi:hypothetical protein
MDVMLLAVICLSLVFRSSNALLFQIPPASRHDSLQVHTKPSSKSSIATISRALSSSSSSGLLGTASTTELPDLDIGLSDEDFHSWLESEFETVPNRQRYDHIYRDALQAIVKWRQRYRGNPYLWKRIFKLDRVRKELIEAVPIIDAVQTVILSNNNPCDEPYTILDMCSGKGYLSMFLSEMLPPEKVSKLILVDKAWAMCNTKELKSHHMNWDHIYGQRPPILTGTQEEQQQEQHPTYFTTWPIPLHTSKQDLKQSCTLRQMKHVMFDATSGPMIILAVHLCGTLSLKAIDMFNQHPDKVHFFALKPCCLPPMIHAQRGDIFTIGSHQFDAHEVCSNGSFTKKDWNGPPRWHLEPKFHTWANHLFQGIHVGGDGSDTNTSIATTSTEDDKTCPSSQRRVVHSSKDGAKELREIIVQVEGGFQNTYMFAERAPLTAKLWGK